MQRRTLIVIATCGLIALASFVVLFTWRSSTTKRAGPEEVLRQFLNAWKNQDYEGMFALISRPPVVDPAKKQAIISAFKRVQLIEIIEIGEAQYEQSNRSDRRAFVPVKLRVRINGKEQILTTRAIMRKDTPYYPWRYDGGI